MQIVVGWKTNDLCERLIILLRWFSFLDPPSFVTLRHVLIQEPPRWRNDYGLTPKTMREWQLSVDFDGGVDFRLDVDWQPCLIQALHSSRRQRLSSYITNKREEPPSPRVTSFLNLLKLYNYINCTLIFVETIKTYHFMGKYFYLEINTQK